MRTVAMLGLLLLLGLAWMFWRTDDAAPAVPTAATGVEPIAGTEPASAEESLATAAPAANVDATAMRTEAPAVPAGPEAVLRGRCVDEQGQPIADVEARLIGSGGNSERMDAWRKDHDEPERIDVKVASGTDGVFELRCWPPPPFQFTLRLTKRGVATMGGSWSQFEPGATKDLGDVRLQRGTLLSGRVVDTAGALAVYAHVRFALAEQPSGEIAPAYSDVGFAKPDGTFAGRSSLIAGEYSVNVPQRTVVSPKTLTLSANQAEQFVEVVVEAIDPSKSLSGIVVDEQGKPVQSVSLHVVTNGRLSRGTTDKEGRFWITRREPGEADAGQLSLDRHGYERLTTTETFAWGRNDIRLVLQRAIEVQLCVVDAEGAPVEDYKVRIFPQPGTTGRMSSRDYEVRSKGRHEGGRAAIQGIRRGSHFVIVEPEGEEIARSPMVPIEVTEAGPNAVTVTLARNAQRELRVQLSDGTPVAGAKVQLADPPVEMTAARSGHVSPDLAWESLRVDQRLQVGRLDRGGFLNPNRALELQAETTDAKGSARLHGPGDRALVVFLPGPGHVPTVVEDVRLNEVEPLVVTVASGASLTGTLRPLAAIAEFRQGAGLPTTGPVEASDRHLLPRIELQRGSPATLETHPHAEQPSCVADDGTFSISDIAAGTWQVRLIWWHQTFQGQSEHLATLTLQEGEHRPTDFDATHLLPGNLDGIVLHNGSPLASSKLMVSVRLGKNAQGYENAVLSQLTTDAEGRFQLRTRAGECRVGWQRQQGDRSSWLMAPERVHVVTGQTSAQTFHVRTGAVRVRLLDAQGRPVTQVPIELRDAAGQHRQTLPATDAHGWTTDELEVEALTAAVLPKRLQDPQAREEVWRNDPGNRDPFAAVRLQCGTVQAKMGATTEVELRLPVEWSR